jgi:hypothetical protein
VSASGQTLSSDLIRSVTGSRFRLSLLHIPAVTLVLATLSGLILRTRANSTFRVRKTFGELKERACAACSGRLDEVVATPALLGLLSHNGLQDLFLCLAFSPKAHNTSCNRCSLLTSFPYVKYTSFSKRAESAPYNFRSICCEVCVLVEPAKGFLATSDLSKWRMPEHKKI